MSWRINVDPKVAGAIGLIITIMTVVTQVPFPPEVPSYISTWISDWDTWFLKIWTPVAAYLALSSSTSPGPLSADRLAESNGQVPPSQVKS